MVPSPYAPLVHSVGLLRGLLFQAVEAQSVPCSLLPKGQPQPKGQGCLLAALCALLSAPSFHSLLQTG